MTDDRTDTRATTTTAADGGGRRAASAYEAARSRTAETYAGLRTRTSRLGERTGETVESSPMLAVAGGFAVGAVLAALLPRTTHEARMFGQVGRRIHEAAREAAHNAADVGREKVEEITQTAKAKVGEAVIGAVSATTGGASGDGGGKA